MDQIATLLQFEPERDYYKWKEQCRKLMSAFNEIILRSDDSQLDIIFRTIIKELKKQMLDMSEVVSLRVLAICNIYFSFQDTFDLSKGIVELIEKYFLYGSPIVIRCTGKVTYKLGLKSSNISSLWKKFINYASLWLRNASLSCLWYSSLVILSFATKAGEMEAINVIRESISLISKIVHCPDSDLQQIAIKTIKYFFKQTFVFVNKSRVRQFIINGLSIIKSSNSKESYGIIKSLVAVDKSGITIDDELAQEGCEAFFYAMENYSYPTDFISGQLFIKLIQKYSLLFDMKRILDCLTKKPIQFVPLIEKILLTDFFHKTNYNFTDFIREFFKVHENDLKAKCQGENCPYRVLRAFYKVCPEIVFEVKVPINNFCRHYCQCIELKPHIFNTALIPDLKQILFDPSANEELRISSIMISRLFVHYFFDDNQSIITSLSAFFTCPHLEIRKEIIKSISLIDADKALDFLIFYALMDPSKEVRAFAIEQIRPSPSLATKMEFFQCLNDPCFRVRRKAIKLTISVLKYNHIELDPLFYQYYNKIAVLLLTSLDSKFCAKVASLFPVFFSKTDSENIYQRDSLVVFTISIILNILGPPDKTYDIPMMMKNNLNKMEIANLTNKTTIKAKLDRAIRNYDTIKRDGYLLKTLAKLGPLTEPYLNEILETFCYIFENRSSDTLLLTAFKSLTKFSSKLFHGLNIRLRCPQIISPLLKFALTSKNNELGIALLKLFGSAFDSLITDNNEEPNQKQKIPFNPDDPYFYTNFIITTIIDSFPDPTLPFFQSLAMIMESDSIYASKIIPQVVRIFMVEIEILPAKFQKLLFSYMMVLPFKYRDDMESLLDSFTPFILKHLKLVNCVSFAAALSYRLKFSFISVASVIYNVTVSLMSPSNSFEYFKELIKLNALMIIYQNQPFELFLNQLSSFLKSNEAPSNDYVVEILNILIGIIQSMPDVILMQSRLSVIAHQMIKNGINPLQMIFSLCIFTKTSPSLFTSSGLLTQYLFNDQFSENENDDIAKTSENLTFDDVVNEIETIVQSNKVVKISDVHFLEDHEIVVKYSPLCPKFEAPSSYFADFDYPNDISIVTNWMNDLLFRVVEFSPSPTIRACRPLIEINPDFGKVLLPIAFYSCWIVSSINDQKYFSNIVDYIMTKLTNIPDTIFELMELVDRWGYPLDIDIKTAAKLCKSQQYSILLIERYLKDHPQDPEAIDFLIDKYLKMGKISTAKGLFRYNEKLMDKMTIAKWSGKLGDWEKALDIYKEIGAPSSTILQCLVCLRKVKETVDFYDFKAIERIPTEELSQMSASLLWAYHFTQNDNVILPFMKIAQTIYDPSCLIIFVFYEIKKLNLNLAQEHVDAVFQILNEWLHHVHPNDSHKISIIHNYAQLFVEAEDAIFIKKLQESSHSNEMVIKEDWEHRVTGFKRETSSWELFILLRNLILPIETNIIHYLKIIASLRKYRQFVLINDYFTKAFDRNTELRVLFERIKIVWEAGDCINIASLLENISWYITIYNDKKVHKKVLPPNNARLVYFQNSFLNCFAMCAENDSDIHKILVRNYGTENIKEMFDMNDELENSTKDKIIDEIFDSCPDEVGHIVGQMACRNMTPKLKSSVYRLTGSYMLQLYGFSFEILKRAEKYVKLSLELTPNNYKCWMWWGYLNAQLFFIAKSRNNASLKQSTTPPPPPQLASSSSSFVPLQIPNAKGQKKMLLQQKLQPPFSNQKDDELLEMNTNKAIHSYSSSKTSHLPLKRAKSGKFAISLSDDDVIPTPVTNDEGNSILTPTPSYSKKHLYIPVRQRPFLKKQQSSGKRFASVYDSDVLLKARERTNLFPYDKQNNELFLATGGSFTGRSNKNKESGTSCSTNSSSDFNSRTSDGRLKELSSSDSVQNEEKFEVYDDIGTEKAFVFAMNSINGFLKATQMNQKFSLAYLCKMFSVVFCLNLSRDLPPVICRPIEQLPTKDLLKVVPQITSHIDHQDKSIQSLITSILYKIGEDHFQDIFFPLKLYSTDTTSETRSKIASDILSFFKKAKADVYRDADLFTEGMIHSAITWFESWITTIESVIRIQSSSEHQSNEVQSNMNDQQEINENSNSNEDLNEKMKYERIKEIILKQLDEFDHPKCDLDALFKQFYQPCANEVRNILQSNTKQSEKKLYDVLKSWYQSLKSQFGRLSCIILEKVSRELAAKRHFSLFVPGEEERKEKILSIHPILEIIGTQQRPRCLFINSEKGKKYKYLLKGNEDIRVDERLMQFFTLVNIIMKNNRRTREIRSLISCYTVIPISRRVGIIGWVQNADTMHHLIKEYRYQKHIEQQIESTTIEKKYGVSFLSLNFLQRLEVFNDIIQEPFAKCEEINEVMWMKSKNASSCLRAKRIFTETTALMSMVGYVIGLGDRHPNNIMIQRDFGNVIHIDFGESFDSTLNRRICPEKVPFRLTRMIINTLEGKNTHGLFMDRCSLFMDVIRENQNSLSAQLAIFADDPVFDNDKIYFESSLNFNRKIYDKIVGYRTGIENQSESVSEQVKRLIEQAEAPENYVKHYPGWCPFW
ncbi:hypothetical protein M9Y10_038167 [Tritrichomonas musculus]|uniref:non-specific serine/threonine protein kinase n=1 Tax=Tritrichomonas musculus TaxID=1915356 RepID=A0ABR2K7N6_9EUKA